MPLATLDEVASLEGLAMTQVSAEPLKAGQPVFVGTNGTLYIASAASGLNRGIIDGFARADTAAGQPCQIEDRHLILADWTQVVGTTDLVPGTRYYLDTPLGKLAAAAPSGAGVFMIRVGVALNARTLRIQIVDLTGAGTGSGTPAPVLAALGFSTLAGTVGSPFSATITGRTSSSTLAATSNDGTALTIANGVLSGTFATVGQKQITITETLAGATGSPKQTAVTVTIAAATPVLQALTLSASSFTAGAAAGTVIGAIQGLTAGSTFALADSHNGAVALSGTNLVVGASASVAGNFPITLTETLAGATGSPKSTTLTIAVGTASAPSVGTADFSDPNNSGLAGAL